MDESRNETIAGACALAPILLVLAIACGDGSAATGDDTAPEDRVAVVDLESLCASRAETEPGSGTTTVRLDDYCVVYDCETDERAWCATGVSTAYRCYLGCAVINYVADAEESGFDARTFSVETGELVGVATSSDTPLFCDDSFALIAGEPEPPPWSARSCGDAVEVSCCLGL